MGREAYESFVVRIWRQQVTNAQERQWCGEIEQIQNGLRWRSTVIDFMANNKPFRKVHASCNGKFPKNNDIITIDPLFYNDRSPFL